MKSQRHIWVTVRPTLLSVLVLLATLLSSAEAKAQSGVDEVKQVIADFLVPFSGRDVAGFMRYFADDATVFFPPSARGATPGRVQGKAGIAKEFEALYQRTGVSSGTQVIIQPRDMMVQPFDDFAVVSFHLGTETVRGRRSFVLRRTSSGWRIVHLHASDFRQE